MPARRTAQAAAAAALLLSTLTAATRAGHYATTWIGPAGNWNDPAKWSSADYPHNNGDTYDVYLNSGTVTSNVAVTIDSLTMTGGAISGAQGLSINGAFTWSDGSLSGGALSTAGQVLASGNLQLDDFYRLVNQGVGSYSGDGSLWSVTNSAYFRNAVGGQFTFAGDSNYVGDTLHNNGTLIKMAGGIDGETLISAFMNNSGTVDVQSGKLVLTVGGASGGPGSELKGAGIYEFREGNFSALSDTTVSAANILLTGGTTTFSGAYSVGTTGIQGGVHTFAEPTMSTTTLTMNGGTLTGNGELDVNGLADWSGGTMGGDGLTTFHGDVSVSGEVALQNTRAIDVRQFMRLLADTGHVNQTTGNSVGIFTSGTLTFQSDADLLNGRLESQGAIVKSMGGDDGVSEISANLQTTAASSVRVESGTLRLTGGGTHEGAGTVLANGTLEFGGGNHTLSSTAGISGPGAVVFSGGNNSISGPITAAVTRVTGGLQTFLTDQSNMQDVELLDGAIQGSGDLDIKQALKWSGGAIRGTGDVHARGGMELSNYPAFEGTKSIHNYAVARIITDTVIASQAGTTFVNEQGAELRFETDADYGFGEITNYGKLLKTAGDGESRINAHVTNYIDSETVAEAGTLVLAGGGDHHYAIVKGQPGAVVKFEGNHQTYAGQISAVGAGNLQANYGADADADTPAPGQVIYVQGDSGWDDGVAITGAGFVTIEGGTVAAGDDSTDGITAENLAVVGGELNGSGTLDVNGMLLFTGGKLGGDGVVNLNASAEFRGDPVLAGSRTINNEGNVVYSGDGGRLTQEFGSSPVLNNRGTFTFAGDSDYLGLVFNNEGSLIKQAGEEGGLSTMSTVNNSGSVEVQSGTLSISASGLHTGSFVGSGILSLGGPHQLQTGSSVTVNTARFAGTIDVDGAYNVPHTEVAAGDAKFNTTASTQTLDITGGSVGGAGTLNVSGPITWTSGGMGGSGVTNAMGPINVSGFVSLDGTRTLNNYATTTYSGDLGRFWNFPGTSTFHNRSGAQLTFAGDSDYYNGTIQNDGALVKQAGASDGKTLIDATLNNASTVEVHSGTLALNKGGTHSGQFFGAGTLEFSGGTNTLQAGSQVTVDNVLLSGGTTIIGGVYDVRNTRITAFDHHFNSSARTETLQLEGGTIHGNGVLTVTGTTAWSSGWMRGGGVTQAQGDVLIPGWAYLVDTRSLNNEQLTVVQGDYGGFWNGGNTTFNNLSTAELRFEGDSDYLLGTIQNQGLLTKQAGSSDGVTEISAALHNTGTIDVQSGSLNLTGAFSQTAGELWIGPGAKLTSPSLLNVQAGVLAAGNGATIDADLSIGGVMQVGASTGVVTVDGDYSQAFSAALAVDIGGRAPGLYDQLNILGAATLRGTLDVSLAASGNGVFAPVAGDVFEILTAGTSMIGTFGNPPVLPPLAGGLSWNINYDFPHNRILLEVQGSTLTGDFDGDGDVDGLDFLKWQRGESPTPLGADDLALWESQYGMTGLPTPLQAAATIVPEPSVIALLFTCVGSLLTRRHVD